MGLEHEPCREVEGERTLVAFLSVDDSHACAAALEPAEAVGHERDADAVAVERGFDGEALEVAAIGGSPGDGVAGDPTVGGHPEPAGGRSPNCIIEPRSIERPERVEGPGIDAEHVAVVSAPGATVANRRRWLGKVRQIVAEEVEAFVLAEPRSHERTQFALVQSPGENQAHALGPQLGQLALDVERCRSGPMRHGGDYHGFMAAAPSRHLEPGAGPPPPVIDGQDVRPGSVEYRARDRTLRGAQRCLGSQAGTADHGWS